MLNILQYFKILFFALVLLLVSGRVVSGQIEARFERLSIKDGLSNNTVIGILKDSRGYMWFGTYDGLNRYDGTSITCYRNDPKNPRSLMSNHILSMAEDADGDILVGNNNELSVFHHNKENFTQYRLGCKDTNISLDWRIPKIFVDKKNGIWLGTTTRGLIYFDKKTATFTPYFFRKPATFSAIYEIVQFDDTRLLLSTSDDGLLFFNLTSKTFQRFDDTTSGSPHRLPDVGKTLLLSSNHTVWVGAYGYGLYKLDNSGRVIGLIRANPLKSGELSSDKIRSVIEGAWGNLWIATDGGGLNRLDTASGEITVYRNDPSDGESLSSNQLYSLYYDNTGILWTGSFGGGISMYDKKTYKFAIYKPELSNPRSLSNKQVLCFLQDRDGDLWVGTDGGGINLCRKAKLAAGFDHFKHDPRSSNSPSSNVIKTIFEDKEGILWFGSYNGGLIRYDKKIKKFTNYLSNNDKDDRSGPYNNNVWSVFEDSHGVFWVGCLESPLDVFDKKTGTFLRPYNKTFSPNSIHTIYEDRHGRMWFGSPGDGLFLYNRAGDTFTSFVHQSNDKTSISNNYIYSIIEDQSHRLWVGTASGINLLNDDLKTFISFSTSDGLPNEFVCGIIDDRDGSLWLSTYKGISHFDVARKKFRNYDVNDGLQSDEFVYSSCGRTLDGRFFFGGIEGFNVCNTRDIRNNPYVPRVVITEFKTFNKLVKIDDESHLLQVPISQLKRLVLSYKISVFSFTFSALSFSKPHKNKYAYYMEGFEDGWNYVGAKHEATYTNLNPGTYTFRVKACNNDGVWNEEGIALEVVVVPPWWKTKTAIFIFVAFVIGLLAWLYNYRVNRLNKQKALLEKLVDERTTELARQNEIVSTANELLLLKQAEIEEKNNRLVAQTEQLNETNQLLEERRFQIQRQSELLMTQKEELKEQHDNLYELNMTKDKLFSIIGHDLRNSFSAIHGCSELLMKRFRGYSPEKIETQLGYIKDAASDTLKLLNNLLEWSRSQRGIVQTNMKIMSVVEIFETELRILEQQASQKDIKLRFMILGEEFLVVSDSNVLSTVMRNLVSNAIKFSINNNSVYIMLDYELRDTFTFSVRDEGVGMSSDKINTLFDTNTNTSTRGTAGEKGTGLGLLLCADFVKKLNGKIWVESKPDEGSTFYVSIPAKQQVSSGEQIDSMKT